MSDAGGGPMRADSNRSRGVFRSFDFAAQGVMAVFGYEPHMRFHFWIALIIALWAVFLRLPLLELLFVYSGIVLVILMEMFNSTIEDLVDLASPGVDARAGRVKDIAAGCVLVSCVYSVAVFVVVFLSSERVDEFVSLLVAVWRALIGDESTARVVIAESFLVRQVPTVELGCTGLVMLALLVVIYKERATPGKGRFAHGGWVSGHAALASYVAAFLILRCLNFWVTAGVAVLAGLVAQSRVEGSIHTWREIARGIVMGVGLAVLLFLLGRLTIAHEAIAAG